MNGEQRKGTARARTNVAGAPTGGAKPSKGDDTQPDTKPRPPAKTVAESAIVMSRAMQPMDANVWGNGHGGAIMRLVDEAGGAVAVRHSRRPCVTVAMDSMTFKQPVYIGDLLTIRAWLTSVGRTSMEVEATIEAENLRTGEVRHAGTSYLIYVALDEHSRPTPAPPLELRTAEERARWAEAERRRANRRRE